MNSQRNNKICREYLTKRWSSNAARRRGSITTNIVAARNEGWRQAAMLAALVAYPQRCASACAPAHLPLLLWHAARIVRNGINRRGGKSAWCAITPRGKMHMQKIWAKRQTSCRIAPISSSHQTSGVMVINRQTCRRTRAHFAGVSWRRETANWQVRRRWRRRRQRQRNGGVWLFGGRIVNNEGAA